jgi:DNA polymerase-3 subunit epsilon
MKWKDLPIVAFDTETTGLEPFGGDRIIEIAIVELRLDAEGKVAERRDWAQLINPERDIPRKVTEITGISAADVANKPRFEEMAGEIREWLGRGVTVAHNYAFDLAFLTREFDEASKRMGDPLMRWPEPVAEVDTVDLSMRCFPDARSHKLSDLSERLGVQLERAHRATDDAAACGYSFVELVRRDRVEDDLQAMLDWANAIGRPPEDGPIGPDEHGRIVFQEGPLRGEPVAAHPIHLQWMDKALTRAGGQWRWKYPDSVRRWARRWLEVRGAGRARQGQKGFHAADWAPDPCIALPRHRAAHRQSEGALIIGQGRAEVASGADGLVQSGPARGGVLLSPKSPPSQKSAADDQPQLVPNVTSRRGLASTA